jgi:hypothetical protein
MKAEEADTLGKRIINTFRNTPALTEWRDVLRALDQQRAVQTFELCRNTIADNLPIARYLAEYRARPIDRQHRPACTTCDGEGYLKIYFERNSHEYAGLSICRDCDGTYNPPAEPEAAHRVQRPLAWQAYNEECMRAGRRPNPHWFDKWMTVVGVERARARHPAAHGVDTSPTEPSVRQR